MTKTEKYIETLAYGDNKSFGDADYYINNLERASSYLASTEVGDKPGSEYLTVLADGFRTAKNGFADDVDFSSKVSAMLANLGVESTALGFVGGFSGREIERLATRAGVKCDFCEISETSRINVKIISDTESAVNGKGHPLFPVGCV